MTLFASRTCRPSSVRSLVTTALAVSLMSSTTFAVKVAVVRSWGTANSLSAMKELNDHWPLYGDIRVEIDHSLHNVASFTYQDLANTGADVLWLSNPAGHPRLYSQAEIDAVKQYASEGHHILGTYRVFRFLSTDNRKLAPIFGLPEQLFNSGSNVSEQTFEILQPLHPIFHNVPSPFVTDGFGQTQAPADDLTWDAKDLGIAQVLARTDDDAGVITLFQGENHHAIYISKFLEFVDPPAGTPDTQLLYNVLTLDAPSTGACCLENGGCVIAEENDCFSGVWTEAGTCAPNRCPQLGACCVLGSDCSVTFLADCSNGRWSQGASCETDSDDDDVVDGCDRCPNFDDFVDPDSDGVPDGCDRCPGFDDSADADEDAAPDACDECPGFDDRSDRDHDGVPDGCDRCDGADDAKDCDEDETPDGCDTEPDCNQNTVPDHCEIRGGAADCDENGVPDDCQPDSDGDEIIDACDDCAGDDELIGKPCDNPADIDDCKSGLFDCAEGTLLCTDGSEPDDVDTDGDGVYDCNDRCPGTPPGVEVLPDGCRAAGACCFQANICFDDVIADSCVLIGGEFLGHGLTCDGDPDLDTFAGCADDCPVDPTKHAPGQCGCGASDADTDSDGTSDCNDDCPNDPSKTAPGVCGCGFPDADTDGDQTLDCEDGCPTDPAKVAPGICGCRQSDGDSDGDGVVDCLDGCPADPNKTAPGECDCGHPDIDTDGDGALDCDDECPQDGTKILPGICGCGVPDINSDGDAKLDCEDDCPQDPQKVSPGVCGCGIAEADLDGDRVVDCKDLCLGTPPDEDVDETGCPFFGACCFRIGVCVDRAALSACLTVHGVYQGNGTTCGEPCLIHGTGDVNGDGKANLDDFAEWADCMDGPGITPSGQNCDVFDLTLDNDVDLADYGRFQRVFGDNP